MTQENEAVSGNVSGVFVGDMKKPKALILVDEKGRLALEVDYDGSVVFGPGITHDEASREFWKFIGPCK